MIERIWKIIQFKVAGIVATKTLAEENGDGNDSTKSQPKLLSVQI